MTSVFIVEDELELQTLYEMMLKGFNYDVMGKASNGEEAVQMYKNFNNKPDIILMDHRMPIKTGIEASKEILEFDQSAKIIFTSADESVKEIALSIGVFSFISKPFEIRKFKENIDDALV